MSFRRLPTEIDGVVLVEPDVHGDERGFLVETVPGRGDEARGDRRRLRPGEPQPVLRPGACAGSTSSAGQAKLVRCARGGSSTSQWTSGRTPHLQALGGHDLDDVAATASSSSRTGSATASASSRAEADVIYRLSSYYDPELESGIAWDDPEVAVHWPITDPPSPIETGTLRLGGPGGFGFGPGVRLGQSPMDDADSAGIVATDEFSRCVTSKSSVTSQ